MTTSATSTRQRAMALYAAGFWLILSPAIDFLQGVIPPRPSELQWRFGAVGLFSGFLMTPLLGLLLMSYAANALGHRTVIRTLGFLKLVAAVLISIAIVVFALDAVQLRRQSTPEGLTNFDVTVIKAMTKFVTAVVVFGWLGLASLWDLRGSPREPADRRDRDRPLVRSAPKAEPENA